MDVVESVAIAPELNDRLFALQEMHRVGTCVAEEFVEETRNFILGLQSRTSKYTPMIMMEDYEVFMEVLFLVNRFGDTVWSPKR